MRVRLRLVLAVSMLCVAGCPRSAEEQASPQRKEPAEPQTAVPPTTTVSVTVTPTKLFVRGRPVEPTQLQARLEALAERSPDATVAVQADATVASERMAEVLKTIKAAGFSNVAVATRPVQ